MILSGWISYHWYGSLAFSANWLFTSEWRVNIYIHFRSSKAKVMFITVRKKKNVNIFTKREGGLNDKLWACLLACLWFLHAGHIIFYYNIIYDSVFIFYSDGFGSKGFAMTLIYVSAVPDGFCSCTYESDFLDCVCWDENHASKAFLLGETCRFRT